MSKFKKSGKAQTGKGKTQTAKGNSKATGGKTQTVTVSHGWLYMSQQVLEPEELAGKLSDAGLDVEVWPEAGVLEIAVADKISIDLERIDPDLGDDFSREFTSSHQIQEIYDLTIPGKEYAVCKPVMLKLLQIAGGMICGDTEDFNPILRP